MNAEILTSLYMTHILVFNILGGGSVKAIYSQEFLASPGESTCGVAQP